LVRHLVSAICAIGLSLSFATSRSDSQQVFATDRAPARGTLRTIARDIAAKSGAPFSLAIGADGKIYVAVSGIAETVSSRVTLNADPMANRVFVVEPGGDFRVFAGNGARGFLGDGDAATDAELDLGGKAAGTACCAPTSPTLTFSRSGIAADGGGNLFIADTGNSTIRSIAGPASSEPMIIRSVAGRWAGASRVELVAPAGLAMDANGNLYIADVAANAIAVLRGNELETLAHVMTPGAVAVDATGTKAYVAAPEAARVFEIDVASAASAGTSIRAVAEIAMPAGLAVDAAGNLFIADAKENVIRRMDAKSGAIAVVAGTGAAGFAGDGGPAMRAEFNAPGDLVFDHDGNLFVADQGNRAIREIAQIGVAQAASSVTLTPAGGINFGGQPTGGATAAQAFTLTNSSNAPLMNLSFGFVGADPGDFLQTNSCGSSLAANSSCTINITFTPAAAGTRSATLQVADSDPSSPQTAPVSGFGDDFEITAQGNNPTTVNIAAASTATFHLQVVPDAFFSGSVALQCPINLPAQTTCTLTPTSVKVTAAKAQPFTAAFATTVHQVVPAAPEIPQFPALRILVVAFVGTIFCVLLARLLRGGGIAGGSMALTPQTPPGSSRRRSRNARGAEDPGCKRLLQSWSMLGAQQAAHLLQMLALRRRVALVLMLGAIAAFVGGCHHYATKPAVGTQAGTYTLTITGSAQNAGRGITVTLIVQ
jgi:DNA-binding beta-propeller fold protein YncE